MRRPVRSGRRAFLGNYPVHAYLGLCCRVCTLIFLWWLVSIPAAAGVMTRELLAQKFTAPLMVGEKDKELPVWPVFRQNATATELAGYLFESIDFAAVPGFSGVPVNLLVALDASGSFLDVQVLSHHEPVFLEGLGEGPLNRFVSQYRGLSLKQNIAIDTAPRDRVARDGSNVHIDGVAKATASVRIINQSALSAALRVARKKLGFSGARDPDQIARIRDDLDETISLRDMQENGLFKRLNLSNGEVEKRFAGTPGEGLDDEALSSPDLPFIDMHVALASVPSIGQGLLDNTSLGRLRGRLEEGDHALLVHWSGRYGPVSDSFISGTVPDRLILSQGGLPIEMRDLNLDLRLRDSGDLPRGQLKVFRIISQAGLDPSLPIDLKLRVTRLKGMIYPERIGQDFSLKYRLLERFYIAPQGDNKTWLPVWKQRWPELAGIAAVMLLLLAALAWQKRLTANARHFGRFRAAYLGFTLLFVGWYAQAQLSIVNLTGAFSAIRDGRSLDFMLYDPASLVVWCGVLVSLLIWGRGTFCGWWCPFGALQELTGKLGQRLGVPQWRPRASTDARLKLLKYAVLALIVGSVFFAPAWTDKLVEVEPFKTAITLNFVRSWPYVIYAAGLLGASAFCYKFFCRYLCPFGASLAVMGRFRLVAWLPRRTECGKPCQTCRHRCDYEAIRPNGRIRYEDCFQCMDCVVIYASDERCAPLILEKKRRTIVPIKAA